jgi:predicted phage terminase large subunit-like protein
MDPIKTQEEASSETTREKIWKEWQSSLSTRLEKAAIVILIMTRWHEDDLAGRLLSAEHGDPLPWRVINIPLEADDNDVLGRQPGEPLWPDRYGLDFIKERKQYPQTFNALYQGRPTSEQGNMLKRSYWNYYDILPSCPILCMSVDATFKDTAKSDKVSIQVWGKTNLDYYLIDRVNARMDFTTTLQAIRNLKAKYPTVGMIFIEDKANGSAIINVLQKEITGIIAVNPQGGKESRAQAILPYVVGGNVHLPRTEWISDFVEECASFPKGAHDDDVDSMTQAINMINNYYAGAVVPNEKYEDDNYIDEFNMW